MSLDKDRLGDDMADKVLALMPSSPVAADETGLRTLMKAIAEAIVTEIDAHLEATGTTNVTSGSSAGTYTTTIPEGGAS